MVPFSIYLEKSVFRQTVEISDAVVKGTLGVSGSEFDSKIYFNHLKLDGRFDADRIKAHGKASAFSIQAEQIFVSKAVFDEAVTFSGGEAGVFIAGNIHAFDDFSMEGFVSNGNILFDDAVFEGELSLRDVKGGRNVDLSGAIVFGGIDAGRLRLGAGFYAEKGVFGSIELWDARIEGNVALWQSSALSLDLSQASVRGDVFLSNGSRFASIDLSEAEIRGKVKMTGGVFDPRTASDNSLGDFVLSNSRIGTLELWNRGNVPVWGQEAKLDLRHAQIGTIIARMPESWMRPKKAERMIDEFKIDGRTYSLVPSAHENLTDLDLWFVDCIEEAEESIDQQERGGSVIELYDDAEGTATQDEVVLPTITAQEEGSPREAEIVLAPIIVEVASDKRCALSEPRWPSEDDFTYLEIANNGLQYHSLTGDFRDNLLAPSEQSAIDFHPYDLTYDPATPSDEPRLYFNRRIVSDADRSFYFWDMIDWVRSSNSSDERYSGRFFAQPYEELANFYASEGLEGNARFVNVVKSLDRIWSNNGLWFVLAVLWGTFWGLTTGFGNFPELAFFWFALLVIVGMNRARRINDPRLDRLGDRFWFSLENSLPLIDISYDHHTISYRDAGAWFFHVQKVVGFLLATVLIGALTIS